MPNRLQQPHVRGDDRERIKRARPAAEALFPPKRQVAEQLVSAPLWSARKPRVLRTLSRASARHDEVEAPVSSKQRTTPEIPMSDFARIRAWVKYGLTVAQVAAVYGVTVGKSERLMAKRNEYFVEPHKKGWAVKLPRAERASAVESTQQRAIERARQFAPNGVVHVKQRNGKFRRI